LNVFGTLSYQYISTESVLEDMFWPFKFLGETVLEQG